MVMEADGRILCETATGEPYQPVRIYFRVLKKGATLGRLKRLKCVRQDAKRDRWDWLYLDEARALHFRHEYSDIPKDLRPVQLGYFKWRSPQELHLNVFSFTATVKALDFFTSKINTNLAVPERIRIVNQCFDLSEELAPNKTHPSFDRFFDNDDDVDVPDSKTMAAKLKEIEAMYISEDERQQALHDFMERDTNRPSSFAEEMLCFPNEDKEWLSMLNVALLVRHLEAMEHWKGNKSFTQRDAIDMMMDITERMEG